MSPTRWRFAAMLCAVGAATVVTVGAQAPDNTGRNARDRQATAKTADQQSNATTDVETTRRIRRAIVADKELSTNAHNVKVITRGGKVTLKGPVRTEAEKHAVEAKAADVAGAANVTSEVSVTEAAATTPSKRPRKQVPAKREL